MLLFRKQSSSTANTRACTVQQQSLSQELRVAAAQGDPQKVLQLLEKGAPFLPDKDGRTALHLACLSAENVTVQILIEHQCDLNMTDKLGYTALHRASMEGQYEIVRLLVDAGAVVNKQDRLQENTAVHEACSKGHSDVLKLLIAAHANLYIRNKTGASGLHVACQHGRSKCVRMLLDSGCKIDVLDNFDDTPLHTCVRHLHPGVCKVLISRGAPINQQNKNGDTPLHIACNLAHKKFVKLLLQSGALKNIRNFQNETPLDISARKQNAELLDLMTFNEKPHETVRTARSNNKHFGGHGRRSKIRERLRNAREAGSNWHLLFQDCNGLGPGNNNKNESKARLSLLNRSSPDPVQTNADTYFMDLAGNIKKGNGTISSSSCQCTPWYLKMDHANTQAQQELLDEIDACHDNLSHEIKDLRQVTERKIADLHRGLQKQRTMPRRTSSKPPAQDSPSVSRKQSMPEGRGRLIRSRSESELETDVERGRHPNANYDSDSDTGSNASDDLYLRYWKSSNGKKLSRKTCGTPERAINNTSSNSSRESCRSSPRNCASSRSKKKSCGQMASIHEACQQTMQQFNRIDLDDTCTTPTSGSSHPYTGEDTRTSTSRSGASQWERYEQGGTVSSDAESGKAHMEQGTAEYRASIYSIQSSHDSQRHSMDQLHTFPQPPSMDSGYGTGLSPSPAMCRSIHAKQSVQGGLRSPLVQTLARCAEISTQTPHVDEDNHEYTELEAVLRTSVITPTNRVCKRGPPGVRIPPPPRKPLPPVPVNTADRKVSRKHHNTPITSNV